MDLIQMKKEFGDRLCLVGGIDARAMADPNPARIEHEISAKVPVAKKGGGYIFHSDHSIPDNVSFEQYKRVVELAREYGSYD
jgi:uroporphyrinogen decarboxylase